MISPAPGAIVDASVIVSFLVPEDHHHDPSRAWLRSHLVNATPLIVPIILLTEVSGAIARRTGSSQLAHRAVAQIQQLPALRVVPIEQRLGLLATRLAANLSLRGADAIYVALAQQLDLPLVTWDNEQRVRSSEQITAVTPAALP